MLSTAQIVFDGVKQSDSIEGHIRGELEKLSDIDLQVTSSKVVVAPPHGTHFSGDPYCLRVWLTIEGCPDVIVNHDPGAGTRHDAQQIAIQDTFKIVRRRLEGSFRKRQGSSAP
jgi:hypothetical protein